MGLLLIKYAFVRTASLLLSRFISDLPRNAIRLSALKQGAEAKRSQIQYYGQCLSLRLF